jgi:GAF domain-containing protein
MNKNFPLPAMTEGEVINSAAFDYKGWRERFIAVAWRLASLLGGVMLLVSLPSATPRDRVLFTGLYAAMLAVTFLKTPYWFRSGILLAACYLAGLNALLAWGVWVDATLFFVTFVAMTGLLYDRRVDIFAYLLCVASILAVAITTTLGTYELGAAAAPPVALVDWTIFTVDFLVLGAVLIVTINLFKREFTRVSEYMRVTFNALLLERSELEERVRIRTQELEQTTTSLRASTSIARISSELQDINELMDTVASLTAERFGLSQVGLFLLDDRRRIAFLQAASSQTGKDMIARGYRVDVEKRSVISLVAQQGKSYLVSDSAESNLGSDVNFPFTRSRLALPLSVRGSVIGVMDMHSNQAQAFRPDDAEILQSLADLVAISIENTHLLNDTRALAVQLETLSSYQSQEAWQKYSSRRAPAYQYTPAGIRPLQAIPKKSDGSGLQIPLILRGQTLGQITLKRKDTLSNWTERERALVEKVAEQISLALDNSRLVEEAQKNAQRDQMIANVSSRVRETLDVDSVIRTAAVELRRIFDLKEAEVSVGTLMPSTPAAGKLPGRMKSS